VATIHAIATVSGAILALLERARTAEFKSTSLAVVRTSDLAAPPADGVTLCLHRLNPNQTLRNSLPSTDARRRSAPSLPVDLHYLMTAWATTAARQQLLLAWAMRTLEDTPVLSAESLNRVATGPAVFREIEAVELSRESATVEESSRLWEMLRVQVQPSVHYVARTVLIDSAADAGGTPVARAR
jgi:hypothetical protein